MAAAAHGGGSLREKVDSRIHMGKLMDASPGCELKCGTRDFPSTVRPTCCQQAVSCAACANPPIAIARIPH
jgi:hypothetical protein